MADHRISLGAPTPLVVKGGYVYTLHEGLPFEEALKAVTINAAKILRIADRVGSLEVGKDGDVVVLGRKLFDLESKVLYTTVTVE